MKELEQLYGIGQIQAQPHSHPSLQRNASEIISVETISDNSSTQSTPTISQMEEEEQKEPTNTINRDDSQVHDTFPSYIPISPTLLRFTEIGKANFITPNRVDSFQNASDCTSLYMATSPTKQRSSLTRLSSMDIERGTIVTSLEMKEGESINRIHCIPANACVLLTCGKTQHYYDPRCNTIIRSISYSQPVLQTSPSNSPYLMYAHFSSFLIISHVLVILRMVKPFLSMISE